LLTLICPLSATFIPKSTSLRLSKETVEEIKNRIDAVDVIGDFIKLKRVGQNYRALSPFSDEKTPSFYVFPKNENFKDFSSGKQGDAITFVMEYDGLSYVDALVYLAKKYGVEVRQEEQTEEELKIQNEKESLFIITNFAREYFVEQLWKTREGRSIGLSYFSERGFAESTIRKFELGYSPDQWEGLCQAAAKSGHSEELLVKSGLAIQKEQKIYDRFRGRVIFPIHNATGKTIAFGARILKQREKQAKYINSPETDIYHKSHILYGIYQARRAIRNKDNCYLVEGYTDVISLHQHGIENVVASSGTSLTEQQIKLIKRHTENITVLFDGDEAGIKASLRGMDMILQEGMNVRAVLFPDGQDPDSYAQKLGAMGFREFLADNSEDFIRFKTHLMMKGHQNDPLERAKTINQVVASIALIPDPVKRAVYMKDTSEALSMEETVLYSELNKILLNKKRGREITGKQTPDLTALVAPESEKVRKSKIDPVALQEREAIRLLVSYGFNKIEDQYHLCDHYMEELEDMQFQTTVYNDILEMFKKHLKQGRIIDAEFLITEGTEKIRQEILDLVSQKYDVSENWEKKYHIYVPKETDNLDNTARAYINSFTEAMKHFATRKRHVNVLQHCMGFIKQQLDSDDKNELLGLFEKYVRGEVPLIVPITLLKHHFRKNPDEYIVEQLYMNPYPEELMLRNHV